jgi:TRAP-type transport system small permease protein
MTAIAPAVDAPEASEPKPEVVQAPLPIRWASKLVDCAVIAIGAVMIVLVFINVVLHAFGRDMAWLTELGEFMMVWVTFLGGASASWRGAHMTITEFLDKLSVGRRRWADATIQSLCAAMLVLLFYYGWKITAGSWDNTLTTLEWPMALQYMPLPIGAAFMLLFVLWDLWLILRGVPREQRYSED